MRTYGYKRLVNATANVGNASFIFKKTEKIVRNFALFSFLSYSEVHFAL